MQASRSKFIKAGLILAAFVVVTVLLGNFKPQPQRVGKPQNPVLQVESEIIRARPYRFTLHSFGTVQPRTQSLLVAQVGGQIIEVNPAFRDGGFFNRNDVLIRIDDRDYVSAVKVAKANLLRAQLALQEEQAQAQQAQKDWIRLGDGEQAPDLVLRKPQLAAAEASVFSAQANLEKAELDLERTRIRAPYDGRILSIKVDLGQFVNSNSQLAEIFATDVVEIRLPLKNSELSFIHLPENYRGKPVDPKEFPGVKIHSDLGDQQVWEGRIVRAEAALDSNSHQLYVVAQIQDPFAVTNSDKSPLKIGQYVTAEIEGLEVESALVIPTKSLYQGSYLYTIDNGLLQRRDVSVAFQTAEDVVIKDGLPANSEVVTSPLGLVASGTRAQSVTAETARLEPLTKKNDDDGETEQQP